MTGHPRPIDRIIVRNPTPEDLPGMVELSRAVYGSQCWEASQLARHLEIFPEGQLVAIDTHTNRIVGSASSLIVLWDDYDLTDSWHDFTEGGSFSNHDPEHGSTLYGADVGVHPDTRGLGVGKKIYAARRDVCRSLKLRRIRAGARIPHYHQYAHQMTPEQYVMQVVRGELGDPTLSFQIKQGFRVLGVVRDYLHGDDASHGHAALIEWINHQVARPADYRKRDPKFAKPRKPQDPSPPSPPSTS